MTAPRVTVPVEPTDKMLRRGYDAFHNASAFSFAGRIPSVWSAMLSVAPDLECEAVKGPGWYLVKDFADGWYWSPNAALDHASGAAVWSVTDNRYETDPPAISTCEDREGVVEAFERIAGCIRNRSVNMAKDIDLVRAALATPSDKEGGE